MHKKKKKTYEQPRQTVVELKVVWPLLGGASRDTTTARDEYEEETTNPFGE